MDSGIYRLVFACGSTYVGKSKHLQTRWQQHFDKLKKGRAAELMQKAYKLSKNQLPQTEVLVYCHTDFLDYYEGYFIHKLKPRLNTQIPEPLTPEQTEILTKHLERGLQTHSAVTLVTLIDLYEQEHKKLLVEVNQLQAQVGKLEHEVQQLDEAWNDRAYQTLCKQKRFRQLQQQTQEYQARYDLLQFRVGSANWYQRLFKWW